MILIVHNFMVALVWDLSEVDECGCEMGEIWGVHIVVWFWCLAACFDFVVQNGLPDFLLEKVELKVDRY